MICALCETELPEDAQSCTACQGNPLLRGRYRLEQRIGQGAYGVVYKATDLELDRVLAVKDIPFRKDLQPKQRELFEREAAVLQQLDHPAIPDFYDQFMEGSGKTRTLYLLQEYVAGVSLDQEMKTRRYTEQDIYHIVHEVSGILHYLHSLSPPVIHRDIKPSNLMRRADGGISLIDFGTVRDVLMHPDFGGTTMAGTFGFMAPEQFAGNAYPATDIYGLGATILSLLTREDPVVLIDNKNRLQWDGVIQVSEPMRKMLTGMLAPDLEQRFSDAAALHAPLEALATTSTDTEMRWEDRETNVTYVERDQHYVFEPLSPSLEANETEHHPSANTSEPSDSSPEQGRSKMMVSVLVAVLVGLLLGYGLRHISESGQAPPESVSREVSSAEPVKALAMPTAETPPLVILSGKYENISYDADLRPDVRSAPKTPVSAMKSLGVTQAECPFIVQVGISGETQVLGILESPSCIGPAYQSGHRALSDWAYPPQAQEKLQRVNLNFEIKG